MLITTHTCTVHVGMLSQHFADMDAEDFLRLPTSTNAVESHNRLSKVDRPEILRVAMLTTYKVDMSVALEHMAKCEGMQTSYEDTSVEKQKRKDNRKRRLQSDDEGPPDKNEDFEGGTKSRK